MDDNTGKNAMTGEERLREALHFRETDRPPLDLAGTTVSAIGEDVFERAMRARNLPGGHEDRPVDPIQGIVFPEAAALDALGVDTCRLGARRILDFEERLAKEGNRLRVRDPYGCEWEKVEGRDLYFNQVTAPLDDADEELADLLEDFRVYDLHAFRDRLRADLGEQLRRVGDRGLILDRNCAGLTEISLRLRGYENWFMDTVEDEAAVARLLDILLEHKLAYWELVIDLAGELGIAGRVQVCAEADDLGTQSSLLIAPEKLRSLVFPRIAQLSGFIKERLPQAKFFFHSDGAVLPIIPDLIEAGVDILNPVQTSAAGMDPAVIKERFGRDLVLWGGGIDTQEVLNRATPAEVTEEVRRNLAILAPGGGYVFATVHNIQEDVPPENFWAMWDAVTSWRTS